MANSSLISGMLAIIAFFFALGGAYYMYRVYQTVASAAENNGVVQVVLAVGLVGLSCAVGILARVLQADKHHREIMEQPYEPGRKRPLRKVD